jgi:8-oxo-dGTP pyrophosphatase MutT (NUDIX family)
MTNQQQVIHFGEVKEGEVYRRTVVGVLYNPETQTFVYEWWPSYFNLITLVSGGVEEGEDIIEALKREIIEETGYTDFAIKEQLGGDIYAHYYQPKKDTFYVKHITAFLVVLNSTNQDDTKKEEDELFEVKESSYSELFTLMNAYENPKGNTVEDQIEILRRAGEVLGF